MNLYGNMQRAKIHSLSSLFPESSLHKSGTVKFSFIDATEKWTMYHRLVSLVWEQDDYYPVCNTVNFKRQLCQSSWTFLPCLSPSSISFTMLVISNVVPCWGSLQPTVPFESTWNRFPGHIVLFSFSGRSLIHGWSQGFWHRCCSLDRSWQVMASSILAKFKTLVVAGEAAGGSPHCLLWWVMCCKLWRGSGFPSQWVSLLMWKCWWSAVVSNDSLEESAGVVLCPSLFYDGSGGQGQVGGITGAQSRPWFPVTNWSSKEKYRKYFL